MHSTAIFFITDSYIIANRVLVLDLYTIYGQTAAKKGPGEVH